MGTRTMRSLVVAVSTLLFVAAGACSESDVSGLDAGPRIDAPLATIDAPLATIDGPVGIVDGGPTPGIDALPFPPGPDALIADAFFVGDAGLSVTKSYTFTMNMQDIAQSFASTGTELTWLGADGDPPGSLQFTAVKTDEAQGTVKGQTPFFTWQDWGVPAGAQVVYVGMKSYKRRLASLVNMDHYWAFEIVGDFGESVHYGKDNGPYLEIASLTHDQQDSWETVTGLQKYEVKPLYRASNTRLHVKVWWFPIRSGAIDWRLDELQLEVVYVMP